MWSSCVMLGASLFFNMEHTVEYISVNILLFDCMEAKAQREIKPLPEAAFRYERLQNEKCIRSEATVIMVAKQKNCDCVCAILH